MSTRTGALGTLVFGVDVQSGDVRGDAPSYAIVMLDGETTERDVVTRRKLLRLIAAERPGIVATDNVYELAADRDDLVRLLERLPDGTRLVQVTGDERPEPLSRVAGRHGVPYGKAPMDEAAAAAELAARSVGHEVTAFTDTTRVKVSRGRSTGKGGWSEDRYTRRIHGSVRRRAREVSSALREAGLEFDEEVTEKYGGYARAIFTVEAPPRDIPVSSRRSGDVRVDLERVHRDGIEFRPLAKRRDPVLVGIDPGTTTAVAVCDLDGGVLDVVSSRTDDVPALIEWIIERGRPVLIAADVTPMPATVDKIRRSFDAAGWTPDADLPVDEKLHRTRELGYDNDHERDALAAALFAYDDRADQFDRIARKVPPGTDPGEVIARVVGGGETVEAALAELDPDPADGDDDGGAHRPARSEEDRQRIETLRDRLERLEAYVEELEAAVADREETIEETERALEQARSQGRREARERQTINRLERQTDRLERELTDRDERIEALEGKLDRLKELWRLDHSNFADVAEVRRGLIPLKPVEQFTLDAIEAAEASFGLAKGDVILLRDASGAGRRTAERLARVQPRAVLKNGGLSEVADEVLFERGIPVGPADEVAIEEVDELAVARERDVEAVIEDWRERAEERRRAQHAEMVDRLISEHRAARRGTSPSELLDI